jgi:hypothetical protein
MDFFDEKKQKRHAIRLGVGYALVGLALILATTILLYQSYGYGIDKSGTVYQNGLLFVSSAPGNANIYLNNQLYKDQTNTRVTLPAGQYTMRISRDGYRNWQRAVTVEGSSVERFDYPFLIPSKLTTTTAKKYTDASSISTQSDDRRWLLENIGTSNDFDLWDLNADKPAAKVVSVSPDILSAGTTTTGWTLVSWADDNRHVILKRTYTKDSDTASEYILVDRQNPAQSQNLTTLLGFSPTAIALKDGNYDQYYAYDQSAGTVFTATLKKPTPQLYLEHVLNFAVDKDFVLYATSQDAPSGKVLIRLRQNEDPAYTVRSVAAGSSYLLDLASYSGTPYIAAGAQSEGKIYVYKDALSLLKSAPKNPLVPVQILKVDGASYVNFSTTARYVMAENNDHFAVYDLENDKGYAYQVKTPLDAGQAHATWLDGYHLELVSDSKLRIFDFDGANQQTLAAASPNYLPAYSPNYRLLYTLTAQNTLTSTALRTPKDQ